MAEEARARTIQERRCHGLVEARHDNPEPPTSGNEITLEHAAHSLDLEQVAELLLLTAEITLVVPVARRDQRYTLHDLETLSFKRDPLFRVVRKQSDSVHSQ